jgi:hypothetical protein
MRYTLLASLDCGLEAIGILTIVIPELRHSLPYEIVLSSDRQRRGASPRQMAPNTTTIRDGGKRRLLAEERPGNQSKGRARDAGGRDRHSGGQDRNAEEAWRR